jgi:hypothetical protein
MKATWRPPAKPSDALARGRATFAELGAQVAEVRRPLLTPLYCTSS